MLVIFSSLLLQKRTLENSSPTVSGRYTTGGGAAAKIYVTTHCKTQTSEIARTTHKLIFIDSGVFRNDQPQEKSEHPKALSLLGDQHSILLPGLFQLPPATGKSCGY